MACMFLTCARKRIHVPSVYVPSHVQPMAPQKVALRGARATCPSKGPRGAAPITWMSRECLGALIRGDGCPLCAAAQATQLSDDFSVTVTDLTISRLRLVRNQFVPGYWVLICPRHVARPCHLPAPDRSAYFDDLLRAVQAIERVYRPIKMNFELLGSALLHMHTHICPRSYGDPSPSRPIDPDLTRITLSDSDYAERVRQLLSALPPASCAPP